MAAWLTARGRGLVGPRELLTDETWRGELDGIAGRRTAHRPDVIGVVPGRRPAAIEVELQRKSKTRLRAILTLHSRWIASGTSGACVYVCRDEPMRELINEQGRLAGLRVEERSLRIELLATIRAEACDAANAAAASPGAAA